MKKGTITAFVTTAMVLTATGLFAQIGPPPQVPLDGGAGVLLAMGAAYGAKKLYDSRLNGKKD